MDITEKLVVAVFGREWNLVKCTWEGLDSNQNIFVEIYPIFTDISPEDKKDEKKHKQPDDGNINMKEFLAPDGAGDNLESQPSDPLLPCEVSDNLKSVATTNDMILEDDKKGKQPAGGNINIEEGDEKVFLAPDGAGENLETVGEAEADEAEEDDETSAGDKNDDMRSLFICIIKYEGRQPLLPEEDVASSQRVRISPQNARYDLEEVVATEPSVCKKNVP